MAVKTESYIIKGNNQTIFIISEYPNLTKKQQLQIAKGIIEEAIKKA